MELHLLILIFLVEIVKYHSLCIEIPRDDSSSVCSFCVYFDALLWGQMPGGHLLCVFPVASGHGDWSGYG